MGFGQVKEKAAKGWSAVVEASGIAGSQVAHQSAQLSGRAMENQVRLAFRLPEPRWANLGRVVGWGFICT